jgi:carbon starvation protein
MCGLRGRKGRWIGTAATLLIPAIMVFVKIPGPQGNPIPAWKAIWPAFGATNQLLGALALLVVYTWMRYEGRKAVYVLVPMIFMFVTTLTALAQLVYRNLWGTGSAFVGVVSLVLGILAVAVLINTVGRLRTMTPVRPTGVIETV